MKKNIKLVTIMVCIMTLAFSFAACSKNDDEWESGAAEGKNVQEQTKGNLSEFSTETMTGETVTQDIFKDYDLTMVNIWTTTCGYCITEMPALEIVSKNMPEGTNFISICADARLNKDVAQKIIDESGVTFPTLMDSDVLNDNFINMISVVPTTVFVDKNGKLVGDPKIGTFDTSDMEEMAKLYLDELGVHMMQN